ncbi:MAG: helix-turn-helix transcriptional regulator [Betaproteobacteria bacterium]|nr:helix-turn-helix transcriptional regulator [Betaproteobacteria bacterium]
MNGHFDAGLEVISLTPRESDVLRLIAHGCTYGQAADRLGVSLHTVATHIKNAYRKLGVRSGAAAVMRAVELKLFTQV